MVRADPQLAAHRPSLVKPRSQHNSGKNERGRMKQPVNSSDKHRLELDDIRTYCRMVTALGRTLTIQWQVDALYPGVEKDTVSIQ